MEIFFNEKDFLHYSWPLVSRMDESVRTGHHHILSSWKKYSSPFKQITKEIVFVSSLPCEIISLFSMSIKRGKCFLPTFLLSLLLVYYFLCLYVGFFLKESRARFLREKIGNIFSLSPPIVPNLARKWEKKTFWLLFFFFLSRP